MHKQPEHLTHFDRDGRAHMVAVGDKPTTHRVAVASGRIGMSATTLDKVMSGTHTKGDVLSIARVAGIMAAKKTSDIVPLCHPLLLTRISIDFACDHTIHAVVCTARVELNGRTGVEIEAMCAVQVALLTIYDMCKAIDRGMVIERVRLEHKRGGASGTWQRDHA